MHNNDKAALIKSMNNLIKHIVSSREAQQQIFASLERKDFEKIINNLADPIIYLRLISAQLIAQLLHESESLQQQFCQVMDVHFSNDSELIVSNNFDKIIQSYPHRVAEIFKLVKTHHQLRPLTGISTDYFIWFINPEKQTLAIEYLSKEQINELIKSYQTLQNPQQANFDPMYCIFGVLTAPATQSHPSLRYHLVERTQLTTRDAHPSLNSDRSQRTKPIYFQPYVLRNNKQLNYPAYNSTQPHLVAKLNTENLTINYVASPVKTEKYPQVRYLEEPGEKTSKKISLGERRRLNMTEEQNIMKFTLNQSQKHNLMNGSASTKIKEKARQEISKSSHLPDTNYIPMDSGLISTPVNSSFNFREGLSLSNGLMAPSLKVKNIAMNGRHGWETSKNNRTFDGIPF